MWPWNQEEKLKYGNAKHCLLSLDGDHQAHMHLRFSALKSLELFTWSVEVVFQMVLKFPTKQLIPLCGADWSLFNWSHCSHVGHVWLAHRSHLRMEAYSFRRRDSQRVCWIHTFLARCSRSPISGFSLLGRLAHDFTVADGLMLQCHVSLFSHCGVTARNLPWKATYRNF